MLHIARTLVATTPPTLFGATEFHIRGVVLSLGARIIAQHLAQKKRLRRHQHRLPLLSGHGLLPRRPHAHIRELGGPLDYTRAYYYCRQCGHGLCPFDHLAWRGSRHLTPAVEQLATLAGAVADSFEKGTDLLADMAHVRVGESTVERTTEEVGQRRGTSSALPKQMATN